MPTIKDLEELLELTTDVEERYWIKQVLTPLKQIRTLQARSDWYWSFYRQRYVTTKETT